MKSKLTMAMKKILILITALAITTTVLAQNTYTFDKDHARLAFSAKHFGIFNVEGIFESFSAIQTIHGSMFQSVGKPSSAVLL